MTEQKIKYKKR